MNKCVRNNNQYLFPDLQLGEQPAQAAWLCQIQIRVLSNYLASKKSGPRQECHTIHMNRTIGATENMWLGSFVFCSCGLAVLIVLGFRLGFWLLGFPFLFPFRSPFACGLRRVSSHLRRGPRPRARLFQFAVFVGLVFAGRNSRIVLLSPQTGGAFIKSTSQFDRRSDTD
jgi:hypothetical protein